MFTGNSPGDWSYRAMHRAGFASQPTSVSKDDGLRLIGAYVTAAGVVALPLKIGCQERSSPLAGRFSSEK